MRIFWNIFLFLAAIYKLVIPLFFFLLAVTTAPEDTAELFREGKEMMEVLNKHPAIDILLIILILIGLFVQFGGNSWRHVIHRFASKPRLKRLSEDAKRVAEDIARTMAEHQDRQDDELLNASERRPRIVKTDQRYLSKHMMEAHAIIERLKDVNYWNPPKDNFRGISSAGATKFAAEDTCKAIYASSEKIRCDLEDGFWTIVTKPKPQEGLEYDNT